MTLNVNCEKDKDIHSGHFMISQLDDEDADVKNQNVKSELNNTRSFHTYVCGQYRDHSFDIDASLTKLFECMTLAYSGKITSPRWKPFKGTKLTVKDKVRLNNIIWREWTMQYIYLRRSIICQFAAPLCDDVHTKPEAVVLEGKYWKRRLDTVTAEYIKCRKYFKQLASRRSTHSYTDHVSVTELLDRVGEVMTSIPHGKQLSPDIFLDICDEDFSMDFSDSLFTSLNVPFAFPTPRDLYSTGYRNMIQPGLAQLQPNFDYMDFDPLDMLADHRLHSINEEPELLQSVDQTMLEPGETLMDLIRNNSPTTPHSTPPLLSPQQPLQQSLIAPDKTSPLLSHHPIPPLLSRIQQVQYTQGSQHPQSLMVQQSAPFVPAKQSSPMNSNSSMVQPSIYQEHSPILSTQAAQFVEKQQSLVHNLLNNVSVPPLNNRVSPQLTLTQEQISLLSQQLTAAQQHLTQQNRINPAFSPQRQKQPSNHSHTPLQQLFSDALKKIYSEPDKTNRPVNSNIGQNALKLPVFDKLSVNKSDTPQQDSLLSKLIAEPISSPMVKSVQSVSVLSTPKDVIHPAFAIPKGKPAHRKPRPIAPVPHTATTKPHNLTLAQILAGGTYTPNKTDDNIAAHLGRLTPIRPNITQSQPSSLESESNGATAVVLSIPHPSSSQAMNLSTTMSTATSSTTVKTRSLSGSDTVKHVSSDRRRKWSGESSTAVKSSDVLVNDALPLMSKPLSDVSLTTSILSPVTQASIVSPSPLTDDALFAMSESSDPRRVTHITAEKKRRVNIKSGFDILHILVPSLTHQPHSKVSKTAMLHKTAEYCRKLKQDRNHSQKDVLSLKQEIESLNTSIVECQALLPEMGVPVMRQRVDRMNDMFNEYVRTRTLDNWKFWIFSIFMRSLFESFNNMVSTSSEPELCRTVIAWMDQYCTLIHLRPLVLTSLRTLCTTTSILADPESVKQQAIDAIIKKQDPSDKL